MPNFNLKLSSVDILRCSQDYNYSDDSIVQKIGERAKLNGYLDREDFLTLCYWKTPRSKSWCELNGEEHIKEVTSISFKTQSDRLRIEILTLLKGVAWPTASTILHFCHPERFPILDFRALFSFGLEVPNQYDYEFWKEYTQECRRLSDELSLDMRTIDRALWQYSNENQNG